MRLRWKPNDTPKQSVTATGMQLNNKKKHLSTVPKLYAAWLQHGIAVQGVACWHSQTATDACQQQSPR